MTDFAEIDWNCWNPQERSVLCFIIRGNEVLLIHKKRGLGKGKINAPGGRIEPGETPLAAAIRETQEEVGLTPHEPQCIGELFFQFTDGFSIHCTVFRADAYSGTEIETDEAVPLWTLLDAVPYDAMWADDIAWVPLLVERQPFKGYFLFEGDTMLGQRMDLTL